MQGDWENLALVNSGKIMYLAALAMTSVHVRAELIDKLVTRDGREYLKVEIVENDDVGLKIRHESGTARIPFEKLPADLQGKYHPDPDKAAAQKARESKEQQQFEREQAGAQAPNGSPGTQPAPTSAPEATDAADSLEEEKIADDASAEKLEAYLVTMKLKLETAVRKSVQLKSSADTERSKFKTIEYTVPNGNGGSMHRTKTVPDTSGHARARAYEVQARKLDKQIEMARVLIGKAEARYQRLTGSEASPAPAEVPDMGRPPIPDKPRSRR